MKKAIMVILIIGLLSIVPLVYAGRLCKRGAVCRWHSRVVATSAPTAAEIRTATPEPINAPQDEPACDANPYIPGTCAHATLESQIATWQAANCAHGRWVDGVLTCWATVAPTSPAYP